MALLTEEQEAIILARLKLLIPEAKDEEDLLKQLIADSADFVGSYTLRSVVPEALSRTVGDLAIIEYNRRGTEGEKGRSEGGENYTFEEAPARVYDMLNRYRLARIGGSTYEKTEADQA